MYKSSSMPFFSFIKQGLKFGVVGLIATPIHVAIFVLLIETTGMHPSYANALAFVVAFSASFLGHLHWTFAVPGNSTRRPWGRPLLKFVVVALFGFALNAFAVYIVVDVLSAPYLYAAVFMVTVTPGSVFLLSKLWVFS